MDADAPVLIVGGSLNGLSAALLLAHRGVSCIVVERHPGTSIQYKFRGISPPSMEIYRSLGVEAEIRARDLIDDRSASVLDAAFDRVLIRHEESQSGVNAHVMASAKA